METKTLRNRPAWQVAAGRISRVFGIQFYDLYYGEKCLLSPIEPEVTPCSVEVRLATQQDLDQIIHRVGGETRQLFDHNVAIDSICYVAFHEGTIAGYLWANRQVAELTGIYLAGLPPNVSFMHSVLVFPEHHRKGVFQYLFRVVCNEMHKAGYFSITCFVDKVNDSAIGAFKHEGIEFSNAAVLTLPKLKPILFCRAFT